MRHVVLLLTVMAAFLSVGCAYPAGLSKYTSVDLEGDLDAATLARYRAETAAVQDAGQTGHNLLLERTNWWPIGLVAYWQKGVVRVMHAHSGNAHYMVSESRGYGPFSLIHISTRTVRYDAAGKRTHESSASSVLMGMVAMFHGMSERGDDGTWDGHKSVSLFHHFVNWRTGHGQSGFWFASLPNPAGWGD